MKKSLPALSVLTLMTGVALAQSSVTLYGTIDRRSTEWRGLLGYDFFNLEGCSFNSL